MKKLLEFALERRENEGNYDAVMQLNYDYFHVKTDRVQNEKSFFLGVVH
jgi:hypothetical protein